MSNLKAKISQITKNKDARILVSNFVWLSALQVASYIFPLITIPYLAKVIGADGFGKIAFASAIMIWIQTIADWGFNLTATRDVAQNRDDTNKISEIFSNVLWSRCLLALLSLAILLLLIFMVPKFYENRTVILVTFLMIPGHILFPDWFFQAVERMKYTTLFNVLLKFLFTVAVFVFVKEKEDYILQPLFTSIGYVLCGVISLYLIIGKWGIKLHKPSFKNILSTIKRSTDVFVNNLAPNLYNSLSIVLLGIWGGSAATGIFDGGNKFISMSNQVLSVLEQSFYPFLSRRIDKHNVFLAVNLIASVSMAAILFFGAPIIVNLLLSPEFTESILVLKIMSVSIVFRAISNVYGKNYLIIQHKEKILRTITLLSSVISFFLAIPLIRSYSYLGASIVMLFGIFLMATISMIVVQRIKKQEYEHNK